MKLKAQITPFFSIVMLLVLALFCSALESARISGLRLSAAIASESALVSAFGEYDTRLFERYGLLFYPEGEESLRKRVSDYFSYYEEPEKGLFYTGSMSSLYPFQAEMLRFESVDYALDEGGKAFESQACKALGGRLLSQGLEELLERLDVVKACGSFLERLKEIQERAEEILGLEEKYQEMKRLLLDIQEKKARLLEIGDRLSAALETAKEGAGEEGLFRAEEFREEMKAAYEEWKPLLLTLKKQLEKYLEECDTLKGVSDRIKLLIEEGVRELPDLFENILRESGKAVLDYVEEEGLIRSRISDWTEQLTAALHLEEWLKKENFVKEEEAARTQLRELFSGQEETSKGNWEDADGMSLFELAKDWENKGILALVAPGVEAERVLEGEDLPSFQAGIIEEIQGTDPVTAVMFQEYLFSYLDSFQDQTGCCDLEYILGSFSSDRENLKAVAKELLLLREGLNLAYLYTDPERRQEAKTMAQAITGASGLLVLYPVAELLILSIWAFAEAIVDVRGLMAGEKVPFWKSSQSFHTSLQGLLSSGLSEGEGGQGGFDYETYLRMLLFLRDPAIKRLRAMDVIQWNMQKEYPEFRFSRCISRVQLTLFYKASPIFLSWGGIYHMETRTSYEY